MKAIRDKVIQLHRRDHWCLHKEISTLPVVLPSSVAWKTCQYMKSGFLSKRPFDLSMLVKIYNTLSQGKAASTISRTRTVPWDAEVKTEWLTDRSGLDSFKPYAMPANNTAPGLIYVYENKTWADILRELQIALQKNTHLVRKELPKWIRPAFGHWTESE